ncbi:MAG: type II secretion system F family protein [Candidatus Rokubacteria bacterium]|nr:type II secretion system F family protein [Candidatus Rokubacteria bacterium]
MVYTYKARDKFGEAVWGSMESTAPELVAAHLREIGYFPIQVAERAEPLLEKWRGLFRRVKQKELIAFSRQMATLFGAHLPLTVSLEAMEKQTENLVLRAVIVAIRQDISGGSSLSDAMKKHPKMFSELYVNMVKAGESSGTLDKVMARLAQLAEKEGDTRAKVKSATRYPVIVLSIIPLAFIALVTLVIPKFEGIFAKSKAALPLPTRILMAANQFVADYWYVMLGATLVTVVLIRRHLATEHGKAQWDRLKIKLPVIGPLVLKGALSRFTRVFATLEASGVPILNTLAIASKTVGNHAISAVIDRVAESVKEGKGLGGPLRESEFFPPIVTQMISIGEESGEMEAMLMKVSDYYDAEVEEAVKGLVASIEPMLIVALAGVALLFAMGIFLPMWNLNTAFK